MATERFALVRSLSHQGLACIECLRVGAVLASVFCIVSESVSAYVSSCSFEGSSTLRRGLSMFSILVSSSSKVLSHSSGSIAFVLYLMGKRSGISLRPWSKVKVMALWSESKERLGSMAHCLKVSCATASGLAKERSMTEGRSPACLAKWVISPLWLRREKLFSAIQSAMVVDIWSWSSALSSRDHDGWWRLKSPVMSIG